MKFYILVIVLITSISINSNGQNKETRECLAKITKSYELDDDRLPRIQKVLEFKNLSAEEIHKRAEEYIVYKYVDAQEVIQSKSDDRFICKGIYNDVYTGYIIYAPLKFNVRHTLVLEIKDHKARVTIHAQNYETEFRNGGQPVQYESTDIRRMFPVNIKGSQKNLYGMAFCSMINKMLEEVEEIREAIEKGVIPGANDDW